MPTYSKRELPPCPGMPEDYQLARFGGKYYWRLRRGKRKPAALNSAMQLRSDAMKFMKPTLQQLRQTIGAFMHPLRPWQLHQRLFALLQNEWIQQQKFDYRLLKGMELSAEWPMDNLFKAPYFTIQNNGLVQLTIPATDYAIVPRNRLATEFVLEALLISGEGEELRTATETSVLYDIPTGIPTDCVFEFVLPQEEPWMLLLKAACFEGKERAVNLKHYAVKVVEAGGGR